MALAAITLPQIFDSEHNTPVAPQRQAEYRPRLSETVMDNTLGWINITLPPPERLAALRRRILDWYVSALESLTLI